MCGSGAGCGRRHLWVSDILYLRVLSSLDPPIRTSAVAISSSLKYQTDHDYGAILRTHGETEVSDARFPTDFQEYMRDNYQLWLQFGQQAPHRVDWSCRDLILVTGVDLTVAYDMVAYNKSSSERDASFKIDVGSLGHANAHAWERNISPDGHWEHSGSSETLAAAVRRNHRSIAQASPVNPRHCLFLRGWRLRPRSGIPEKIEAAAGPHDLGSPPPPSEPSSPCPVGKASFGTDSRKCESREKS
jgi:hypothetical protein